MAEGFTVSGEPPAAVRVGSLERPRDVRGRRARVESWMLQAPQRLRALVRGDEIWLVLLAAFVGIGAGLCVAVMNDSTQWAHRLLFGLAPGHRVSSELSLEPARAVLVPTIGGLGVGLLGWLLVRWNPRRAIDPIEANALYGGQMSLNDSLGVVAQTMGSNGVGASVGLEAGYTQIGSAIASRLGRAFRVRRSDLRLLVGCGAAGAIGAAFNAPLTGAFYAFELVIGTYSLATLAPVMAAALTSVAVTRLLSTEAYGFDVQVPTSIPGRDYLPLLAIGMAAALVGIALMRGVTLTEEGFRRTRTPLWLRPAIGGVILGLLALVSPQVLSSGHGALAIGLDAPYTLSHIALLIALKATASAISLGSGFRGGLFFASLFLGALLGKFFAAALALAAPEHAIPEVVCAVVGMSSLAVAVVGGPLTMSFLALESTGSLPLTAAVVAASVISAVTVRRTFGYSFATWRFHLRGEAIRSAVDIGWVRNLTVGRMMRREVRTVRSDTALSSFRRDFPLGAVTLAVVVDDAERYLGIVQVAEAHASERDLSSRVSEIVHHANDVLLPQMTVKEAIAMFERAEADALAVVDGPDRLRVIGMLTEQHALRRYSEELERRRRELSGEA
jgi:CIC family chloride channel protein